MRYLDTKDPLAVAVVRAIHEGDVAGLRGLLAEHPELSTVRLGDGGMARTLLHIATDWPGHRPNGPETVAALVEAGADVNARFVGPHTETPLHWAASNDDVPMLDALLDAGADIEADGAVIGGGTPLSDATAFAQWKTARRLIERGATTEIWEAAALGLMDRIPDIAYSAEDATHSFWAACHGGRRATAEFFLDRGADINWVGYDDLTPLDAALRSEATELAGWLRTRGARPGPGTPAP